MYLFKIFLISFLLFSCATGKKQSKHTQTIYIGSSKIQCTGIENHQCLQIQISDSLSKNWELLFHAIEGFEYEPGYIYKLEVQKITTAQEEKENYDFNQYKLVEVLSKEQDPSLKLHDIYVVTHINGAGKIGDLTSAPTMEINVATHKISGKDGCNTYGASIELVDKDHLQFGNAIATRMACENMKVPNAFHQALKETVYYQQKAGFVYLMNENRKVIITLKKVD